MSSIPLSFVDFYEVMCWFLMLVTMDGLVIVMYLDSLFGRFISIDKIFRIYSVKIEFSISQCINGSNNGFDGSN